MYIMLMYFTQIPFNSIFNIYVYTDNLEGFMRYVLVYMAVGLPANYGRIITASLCHWTVRGRIWGCD